MNPVILPIVGVILNALRNDKAKFASSSGTSPDVIERIASSLQDYLTRDDKTWAAVSLEMENARQHDIATLNTNIPIVNLMRGIVRPIITLTAFSWYVYARANGILLSAEDYAIIGGILAFWFGFRPFEKGVK